MRQRVRLVPMKRILLNLGILLAVASPLWVAFNAQALPLNKCARIIRSNAGTETLINRCKECMKIKVERTRSANTGSPPTLRDFTMMPGANQPLPFRGPGGTRIVIEFPCKG